MTQADFGLFDWIDRGTAPLNQLYEDRLKDNREMSEQRTEDNAAFAAALRDLKQTLDLSFAALKARVS